MSALFKDKNTVIIIAGLGLIGGSMAKAIKKHTGCTVLGWNRTRSVAERALEDGAIDSIASDEDLARCDMLIPVLYPEATVGFLRERIPQLKKGALVVDLCGIKANVTGIAGPLAAACGVRYTGGHPMAGLARGGYERSFADLYSGASMILVPTEATEPGDIECLGKFFRSIGFGRIQICDAKTHDRMIAHTSQLAHVVSNCYVKSPVSANYPGFAGNSYKDMTRVAGLNEYIWSELFLLNRDALLLEIDGLMRNISDVRDAVAAGDTDALTRLLREGREAKERIDAAGPAHSQDR